jgi:hypothetical protein
MVHVMAEAQRSPALIAAAASGIAYFWFPQPKMS